MKQPTRRLSGLLICVLLSVPVFAAGALEAGAMLGGFALTDQHDQPGRVDDTTKLLLFSRDMKANKLAKAALSPHPARYLSGAKAAYVIDVSGMPGFVTRHFAIPKMRQYAYPILIDRDATTTAGLPSQKGQVTLIHLDHLHVTGIEYATTADALNRAVDAAGH